MCSDGHWSYVQPVEAGAVSAGIDARYAGVRFKRFQIATLRVDSVLGEFYWRVEAGERVESTDYIAPPAMLSSEASRSEQTWSLSSYLTVQDVDRAFGKPLGLPSPIGVGPNQPYPGGVGRVTALVAVTFLAVGIGKCASAPDAEKLRHHFAVPATSATPRPAIDPTLGVVPSADPLDVVRAIGAGGAGGSGDSAGSAGAGSGSASPSPLPGGDLAGAEAQGAVMFSDRFQLDGGRNVAFELSAGVDNNWLYAAVDLVEEATGKVVSFDASIEYYSGYDGGESWSEGSRTADQVIAPVDRGSYVLRVEAQHGGTGDVDLGVVVRQGVFRWLWFWIGLGVLGVPFTLVGFHAARFRARRWENSNVARSGALALGSTYPGGGGGSSTGDEDD